MRIIKRIAGDTSGVTAIEYGLLTGLIAIAAMGSMGVAGNAMGNTLFSVSNTMNTAPGIVGHK